jgi:hypothetical protein
MTAKKKTGAHSPSKLPKQNATKQGNDGKETIN